MRAFAFELPEGPYSFQGGNFAVRWALELVAKRPDAATRLNLVVSPTEAPIRSKRRGARKLDADAPESGP